MVNVLAEVFVLGVLAEDAEALAGFQLDAASCLVVAALSTLEVVGPLAAAFVDGSGGEKGV